jgi:hypothetical protein
MTAGAAASGLVAALFDGRSALSMAVVMAASSLLALIAYCLLARPAERRIRSQAVEAPVRSPAAERLPRAEITAFRREDRSKASKPVTPNDLEAATSRATVTNVTQFLAAPGSILPSSDGPEAKLQ